MTSAKKQLENLEDWMELPRGTITRGCPSCLHWEPLPNSGNWFGYCRSHEHFTANTASCLRFVKARAA